MEANNMKDMRDEVSALLVWAESNLRLSPDLLKEGTRECCEFVVVCCKSAVAKPPRACDVMSQEDLTKVIISGFMKSLGIGPENQLVRELAVAAISAAIKCAYDTQLVVKKGGEK